jgi:hypothetical protein
MMEPHRTGEAHNMAWDDQEARFQPGASAGREAALLEIEHQAEHWDTPDHGETGHLIASALRAAVDIARSGGLRCEQREHRELRQGSDRLHTSQDAA